MQRMLHVERELLNFHMLQNVSHVFARTQTFLCLFILITLDCMVAGSKAVVCLSLSPVTAPSPTEFK